MCSGRGVKAAEIARLQVELKVPPAKSLQGAEGDASGQVSRPTSGEHRTLIILEYLRSDAHRRREEFERSHYAHDGFMKALSVVAALYLKLYLSSLYRPT
ncbi:hypothetical protein ACLOJK_037482 [Asimina triloba]